MFASILVLALAAGTARSAGDTIRIARIAGPITLDGRSDEPAWKTVPSLGLTTFLPVAGNRPADSSEVRIGYDDTYLFVAGRLLVADPREIQATTLGRDQLGPDDYLRIMLDTFDDNRTGVGFLVTPTGARSDYDVTGDGSSVSNDWNTYWDAVTARDGRGWYVEMRIPWSSLRFRPVGDRVTMGVIVVRVSARKNEWSTFPALTPDKANAIWRSSEAAKIVFAGLHRRSPVYLSPYGIGGVERTARLAPDGQSYGYDRRYKKDVGGDLKYGLTDDLTLDLTANTDFAQAEADNQEVNLSRFSLFFPEKRQFFLERAGSFEFGTSMSGDGASLFYSRQIGLGPDGSPRRIYGGARVVGRAGAFDGGVLDLEVESDSGGSENIGVARVRRRVLNGESYFGGILTSRLDGSRYNVVTGADLVIHPFGNEYLTGQVARSFDDRAGSGGRASQARLEWARRSSKALIYFVTLKWSGPDFLPRVGFEPRSDYSAAAVELDYNWINRSGYSLQPSFFGYFYRRNRDGVIDSGELYPYLDFGFPSGLHGWVAWRGFSEDLTADLDLAAGAVVPAGRHRYQQGEIFLVSPTGARLGYRLRAQVGGLYDGRQTFVDFVPTWSVSPHLTLGGEYQFNRIRFPTRGQRLDADLIRLRIAAAWNAKLSAGAFLQYNAAGRIAVGNLRIRYRFSEGTDLYLVVNELENTDRARSDGALPRLPGSAARTVLLKYTRALIR